MVGRTEGRSSRLSQKGLHEPSFHPSTSGCPPMGHCLQKQPKDEDSVPSNPKHRLPSREHLTFSVADLSLYLTGTMYNKGASLIVCRHHWQRLWILAFKRPP